MSKHIYRQWVDENDVGNTCCLAPKDDPVHLHQPNLSATVAKMTEALMDAYEAGFNFGIEVAKHASGLGRTT